MVNLNDAKDILHRINNLQDSDPSTLGTQDDWSEAGAELLALIDQLILESELVNALTPKDYAPHDTCLLATLFRIVGNISDLNEPFQNSIYLSRRIGSQTADAISLNQSGQGNTISFYELAISRCCSFISQLLGDRFTYVQKLLIKNILGDCNKRSLFASDVYMFVFRIIHPQQKMAMCQLIMNLCKLAPPKAIVRGAALINRMKHPIVNFENPKYQYLLDFS